MTILITSYIAMPSEAYSYYTSQSVLGYYVLLVYNRQPNLSIHIYHKDDEKCLYNFYCTAIGIHIKIRISTTWSEIRIHWLALH